MIEFEIKSKKQTIGAKKGQTVYYAVAKNSNRMTLDAVCQQIVDETSLSYGDVMNALTTLARLVCRGLKMGFSVDLGDLGALRVYYPSKMVDKEIDVTAASLKTPKIVFTPKAKMREAAKTAEVSVNNPKRKKEKKKEEGGIGQHGN
ncbi:MULTISPECIES: HU family DNA-binding protein [Prevotellaceae]|uniref:HU family DNA-binding protein n=1 Tax=Prevotellaceae TaxID=171552 RepID=UPI000374364E|nr:MULTISPECIES: HU family DNA-binding protein [Prevotellaceae]